MTQDIGVVMPVGPSDVEVERFVDTVASLAWEPAIRWLVVVDDAPQDRDLASLVPHATCAVTTRPHPLRGVDAPLVDRLGAAVLLGLRWLADETDAGVAMKLDTDALVVAPFASKLEAALADQTIGLLGSFDRDCNGRPRSFDPWVGPVRKAGRLVDRRGVALAGRARLVRRLIAEARTAGYVHGEHALACAVALPSRAIHAMRAGGALDDPCLFVGTGLGDDPILGILVRRAGLREANHVDDGDTFAVSWKGLPAPPEQLLARGYSIIHSVKNDAMPENEIRAYFRTLRAAASSA